MKKLAVVGVFAILVSCAGEVGTGGGETVGGETGGGTTGGETQTTKIPTYSSDVKPIIDGNCITGCHQTGGVANFSPLTNYNEVVNGKASGSSCGSSGMMYVVKGNPSKSLLYLKLLDSPPCGGRMPPGRAPLSQEQINIIKTWIENGAPEKGTAPTAPSGLQATAVSQIE